MTNCYRCGNKLTESNASEEHIILNACGGRLTSKCLLCKDCNSFFGDAFDHELAKRTNDLANLLMIKRHRGQPPAIKGKRTKTGEDYLLELGGAPVKAKPKFEIVSKGEQKQLNVEANNIAELKKLLRGLKRKHPNLDTESMLKTAKTEEFYMDDAIEIKSIIGGQEVFKSITKTAIGFYLLNGGQREHIKHLLPYLDGKENHDVVWMHYPEIDIYNRGKNDVTHVIKLIGNSKEGILYAYVELFNVHNFVVRLNMDYSGDDLDIDYVFNVHTYKTKKKVTNLQLSKSELYRLFTNKDVKPFDRVKRRYIDVLTIANRLQDDYQIKQIVSRAFKNSLGNHSEEKPLDQETRNKILNELTKLLAPFIIHRANLNK